MGYIDLVWDEIGEGEVEEFVKDLKKLFPRVEITYWESSAFDLLNVPEDADEDWYWDTLFEKIIPEEMKKGKYSVHIYVPPEEVQVPYGASIFIGC